MNTVKEIKPNPKCVATITVQVTGSENMKSAEKKKK